jgi:mono/diheme cytochrome c family protein
MKMAGYGLLGLVVLLAVAITFTVGWRPFIGAQARPLTDRRFEPTPARLQRGQYLVESVVGCFACHSKYDETSGIPVLISKKGSGEVFVDEGSLRVVASNITPDPQTGIGHWSDDALARAIREGVSHDGRALFPIMPYKEFRHMSDEDLASVIAYVRSVEPVRSQLPKTQLPFPLTLLVKKFPEPVTEPVPPPDLSTPAKRGEYMVHLGACADCHTPTDKMGKPLPGLAFGGGNVFGEVASTNLTPDPSGIPYYDEALFLQAMRTGHVRGRKLKPPMPWWFYRNMNDEDLTSIFAYLRTLKPAQHRVDNTEPPTLCKLCGNKHGLGDRN